MKSPNDPPNHPPNLPTRKEKKGEKMTFISIVKGARQTFEYLLANLHFVQLVCLKYSDSYSRLVLTQFQRTEAKYQNKICNCLGI